MADEANEQEMTDDQSLEVAGEILANQTAPKEEEETETVKETEEVAETDAGSVADALGFTIEDKRALGKVPSLQSKTDSTAAKVEGIEKNLQELVETFKQGLNKQPTLDSEGLTQGLTGEDGPEFLKKLAQEANADLRQELQEIKAKQQALNQAQESQKAQLEYQDELMELSGEQWGKLEPTYNEILEAVALGVEAGNPVAMKKQARLQNNPEYLHHLALEVASKSTRAKAKAHEDALDSEADVVKDASSPGPVVAPEGEISDSQANEAVLKYLLNQ